MSALQAIRNRGVIVAAAVGVALLAFILTDFLNSASSLFSENSNAVAVVNDKEIDVRNYSFLEEYLKNDYQNRSGRPVDDRMSAAFKNQAWEMLIQEALYGDEFDKLGLGMFYPEHNVYGITKYEFVDLLTGKNIDPDIKQIPIFHDSTGTFQVSRVEAYLERLSDFTPQQKQPWLDFEKQKLSGNLKNRYAALVSNGFYTTTKEAEFYTEVDNKVIDFDYIAVKFDHVSDSAVSVSSTDIANYYDENKEDFKTEPTREVEYVAFDVKPSREDYLSVQEYVSKMKDEFEADPNPQAYVNRSSDIPYMDVYLTKDKLHAAILPFADSAKIGQVVGTYFEDMYYKAARFVDKKEMPDTVSARHILVKSPDANEVADSLINLLENGADFASLVTEFSQDPGSKDKGGLYEGIYYGQMSPAFNDTVFMGEPNKFYKAVTRHGVHIIEIMDQHPKIPYFKLAVIARKVEPSNKTHSKYYKDASKFAYESSDTATFYAAIEAKDELNKLSLTIKKSDYDAGSLSGTREMVQWAFNAEVGEVSKKIYTSGNKYIVAVVVDKNDEEYSSLESVEEQIKAKIVDEKKAAQVVAQIKDAGTTDLNELEKVLEKPVQSAEGVKFGATNIQGIGNEPVLLGTMVSAKTGDVFGPITGEKGVYVVQVKEVKTEELYKVDATQERIQSSASNVASASGIINALKSLSDIVDNRIKF